ncbi:MAG: hypothetical protein KDC71_18030 [Acidobacteria bacterium]|nr:hypothetical protein [Acidobacteriota bacterium]
MVCLLFVVCFQNTTGHFWSESIELTINHVTSNSGGFKSALIIDNVGPIDGRYLLTLRDENGFRIGNSIPLEVPANSISRFEDVLLGAQWATILPRLSPESNGEEGERPKSNMFIAYSHQSGFGSEALTKANTAQALATKFRFFPGNWDVHFDGIAIVAHDYIPSTIVVKQINTVTKEILHEETIAENLMGQPFKAKKLVLLGGPDGSLFAPPDGTYFEILSNGLIGLTVLRGNVPGYPDANLWETSVSVVEVPDPEVDFFEGAVTNDGLIQITFKGKHFVSWDVAFSTNLNESTGVSAYVPEIVDGVVSVKLVGFETDANFKLRIDGANGISVYSNEITVPFP